MKSKIKKQQCGFIALISVILVSFALLTFAASVNLSGFLGRYNQLDSETKEQSAGSAEACVNKAIVDSAAGRVATGTLAFGEGAYSCTTFAMTVNSPAAGQTTIKAQGISKDSYTNLVVVINGVTQTVISWREVATLP